MGRSKDRERLQELIRAVDALQIGVKSLREDRQRLEGELNILHDLAVRLREVEVRLQQVTEALKERDTRGWDLRLAVFAGIISIVSAAVGGVVGAMLAK